MAWMVVVIPILCTNSSTSCTANMVESRPWTVMMWWQTSSSYNGHGKSSLKALFENFSCCVQHTQWPVVKRLFGISLFFWNLAQVGHVPLDKENIFRKSPIEYKVTRFQGFMWTTSLRTSAERVSVQGGFHSRYCTAVWTSSSQKRLNLKMSPKSRSSRNEWIRNSASMCQACDSMTAGRDRAHSFWVTVL